MKGVLGIFTSEYHFVLTMLSIHALDKEPKYFPLNFDNYKFHFFIFYFQKTIFYFKNFVNATNNKTDCQHKNRADKERRQWHGRQTLKDTS